MPLQDEERLFIAAMRDLNHQASRMQAEEKHGGTGSSLSGDENDQYQDQSNDDSDASTRSPSSPTAQYLSAAMGPHVVPRGRDNETSREAKAVTEDCVSLSQPARLPLPTHMPQMPANAIAATSASLGMKEGGGVSARTNIADAIAAATASVVDAAMRLSTACPPGPHTHACGSGTTTYATSNTTVTATATIDSTSMINSDGPVAPGKEGYSEHLSVTQEVLYLVSEEVREEEAARPLKRSAVDAGLI